MYTLQQQDVATSASEGYNITVNAVAGSGKTTTCRLIIQSIPDKKVLLILYNRELSKETKQKFKDIPNVEVRTLHSFIQNRYHVDCSDDRGLILMLDEEKTELEKFDTLIFDEAQDMTKLMYNCLCKIISDFKISQLILLGDLRQCIYDFRGADPNYLHKAEDKFPFNNWKHLKLTTTFRCPENITKIINLTTDIYMESARPGGNVEFHTANMLGFYTQAPQIIVNKIKQFLEHNKYEDIAILTYSSRHGKNPITILANYLTKKGFPIYFPSSDDQEISQKLSQGKIVISTFHGFKGRERKLIFIYGLDNFLSRYMNFDSCPNLIYVALTRTTDELIIINDTKQETPLFLKNIYHYAPQFPISSEYVHNSFLVTNLVKSLSIDQIIEIENYFTKTCISPPLEKPYTRIVKFEYLYEDTSSILGDVVTFLHMYSFDHKACMYYLLGKINEIQQSESDEIINESIDLAYNFLQKEKHLKFIAICVNIINSRHARYMLRQIKNYKWLKQKRICKTLEYLPKQKGEYEKYANKKFEDCTILGYADLIIDDTVYEIKYTQSLRPSYFIQLVIYMCLLEKPKGVLVNTMTGESFSVELNQDYNLILKNCLSFVH